jgi:YVTN family beta-propeller protein
MMRGTAPEICARRAAVASFLALAACTNPTLPGVPPAGTHPAAGVVVATALLGFQPFGIAVSRAGIVYATQLNNASLSAGSTATLLLSGSIAVGNSPTAVAFDPAGTSAYVANQISSNVGVVDVASSAQVSVVPVTGNPFNVIVAPDGARVYVATSTNQVHAISTSSRTITGSVAVAAAPSAMAFGSGDTLLYVSSFVGGAVTELNVKGTPVATRVYSLGGTPQGIAVSPGRDTLYVANESGVLQVVDIASGTISAPVNFGSAAFGLALTPDATQLYATLPNAGAVSVIDRASLTIIKTIPTSNVPRRIAFSPDGLTAAVACEAGAVVFIR